MSELVFGKSTQGADKAKNGVLLAGIAPIAFGRKHRTAAFVKRIAS